MRRPQDTLQRRLFAGQHLYDERDFDSNSTQLSWLTLSKIKEITVHRLCIYKIINSTMDYGIHYD